MSVYDNAKQSLKSSSMKRESSYVPSKISSPQTTNYDFATFTKFDDNTKENMANKVTQCNRTRAMVELFCRCSVCT